MIPEPPVKYDDEENEVVWNVKYPVRNYAKQEKCPHDKNFTLITKGDKIFFKCMCSLTLGEESRELGEILEKVAERLLKERERLMGRVERVVLLEKVN